MTETGGARKESRDSAFGEAEEYVQDRGGHLCRSFCLDIGLACHAGDVVA